MFCRLTTAARNTENISHTHTHTHTRGEHHSHHAMCVFLRFLKKRQKLLDKLLSSARGSGGAGETQQRCRRRRELPMPEPSGEMEAGPEMRGGEGVWPESVAAVEGAWSVDVAQNSLISMRDGSEEVCPRGVAVVEGAWSVARAPNSLVSIRDGSEEVCPRGVATVDGAWSVGEVPDCLVSAERLFVFRCVPPTVQQNTQTSLSRKKKRSFLNFKKSSVAPQPNT